jgi:hypothetical protein
MENFVKCSYLPDGYSINLLGEIKNIKGKIMKCSMSNSGYWFVNIKGKGYFVHRAICFAFIEKIEGKDFVNHKDGNKLNNDLSNLEWCTKSFNLRHAYDNGLKKYKPLHYKGKFGKDHNRSKAVICVESGIEYGSMSEASRELKIHVSSVHWSIKHKKPIFGMHFEIKQ